MAVDSDSVVESFNVFEDQSVSVTVVVNTETI